MRSKTKLHVWLMCYITESTLQILSLDPSQSKFIGLMRLFHTSNLLLTFSRASSIENNIVCANSIHNDTLLYNMNLSIIKANRNGLRTMVQPSQMEVFWISSHYPWSNYGFLIHILYRPNVSYWYTLDSKVQTLSKDFSLDSIVSHFRINKHHMQISNWF